MSKKFFLLIPVILLFGIMACSNDSSKPVVRDGYLQGADEAQIFYRVKGAGEDTLVVIHGGPGAGMNSVIPAFKLLEDRYTLVYYDQRGGGKSELPADTTKLKPEYFVEDLEAVRLHFGLERMNLITHSFGSVLAAKYAIKYPDHINRMIFHGATAPDLMQELELRRKKANQSPPSPDTALSKRASTLIQQLLNGKASDPVAACHEYEEISRKLTVARGDSVSWKGTTCEASPEAVHYYYRYTAQLAPRYFGPWDFTDKLEQVSSPLLVIWGKQDSLMIPAQRAWAEAVSKGRLLLVPEADKAALTDNPEVVLSAIDTFLDGKWPEQAVN